MNKAQYFERLEMSLFNAGLCCLWTAMYARRALYQAPSRTIMSAASSAASANHDIECWPKGNTMMAASNGPRADPPLPPT